MRGYSDLMGPTENPDPPPSLEREGAAQPLLREPPPPPGWVDPVEGLETEHDEPTPDDEPG